MQQQDATAGSPGRGAAARRGQRGDQAEREPVDRDGEPAEQAAAARLGAGRGRRRGGRRRAAATRTERLSSTV